HTRSKRDWSSDVCSSDLNGGEGGELTSSDDALEILIGSSGEAETAAVEDAVAAWSADSGIDASVSVANDLPQQLSQGFAAGTPRSEERRVGQESGAWGAR